MEKILLEWINSNRDKVLESPRKEIFKRGRPPQNFKIVEVDEGKKRIEVMYQSKIYEGHASAFGVLEI